MEVHASLQVIKYLFLFTALMLFLVMSYVKEQARQDGRQIPEFSIVKILIGFSAASGAWLYFLGY